MLAPNCAAVLLLLRFFVSALNFANFVLLSHFSVLTLNFAMALKFPHFSVSALNFATFGHTFTRVGVFACETTFSLADAPDFENMNKLNSFHVRCTLCLVKPICASYVRETRANANKLTNFKLDTACANNTLS